MGARRKFTLLVFLATALSSLKMVTANEDKNRFRRRSYHSNLASPPDKWLETKPNCGRLVPGTPFVACKVPLSAKFEVPRDELWGFKQLRDCVSAECRNVIDLTFTDRYYSSKNAEEFGF